MNASSAVRRIVITAHTTETLDGLAHQLWGKSPEMQGRRGYLLVLPPS
jgi:hypothetical protein